MGIPEILGYLATAFNIAAYSMRTMIPLRILAISSNAFFIAYGALGSVYPILVLHTLLLPLNSYRLREMIRLTRSVRNAAHGDMRTEWLRPFMARRPHKAGEVIFRRGEIADELFIPLSGLFRLAEIGVDVPVGQMVGELGFLSPDNHRTLTLECVRAGDVLSIHYQDLRQLFFQNPEFGFYFLRLTSGRLFENLARLEGELASLRDAVPAGTVPGRPG
ncbi:MAG: cyclic nucleotide-binding domain-containing protein [Bauldia sp.]|nr:cyclic nucleotide-binding domain-containing protein [Bauldia sp.]